MLVTGEVCVLRTADVMCDCCGSVVTVRGGGMVVVVMKIQVRMGKG